MTNWQWSVIRALIRRLMAVANHNWEMKMIDKEETDWQLLAEALRREDIKTN